MSRPSDAERAFRVTLTAAILNVVGVSIDLGFWRARMHTTPPWHLVSAGVSVCIGVLMLCYRHSGKGWIASLAFVVGNIITEVAVWRASTPLAMSAIGWAPFQPEKLGVLTVAVLAPPNLWAGVLSILVFGGSAVAHFFTFSEPVREKLIAEPWASIAYTTFAMLLYVYRLQARNLQREMSESLAAKRTSEHVSRMILAVRDFSNTPLQTMYLTTALLRERHGDEAELLARLERSLARLRELNEIMSRYESQVGWQDGDASMDASDVLQRGSTVGRASPPNRARPTREH
jgi:hypothetical protein